MFISKDEAKARLLDPRNVLSRVQRESRTDPPIDITLPVMPELVDLDAIVDEIRDRQEAAPFDPITYAQSPDFDPFAALKLAVDIDPNTPGRKLGIRNRTNEENASVAVASMLLGSTVTQDLFGVRPSQQHVLTDGYTGSVDHARKRKPKEDLLEEIYTQGQQVTRKAFGTLNSALGMITDDKLKAVHKAVDLVKVSTGMSRIIRDLTPKESGPDEGGVHFHVYRPEQKAISDYEMVVVGAGQSDGAVSESGQ